MMIATDVRARNALWLPMLMANRTIARMPTTMAGTIGTFPRPETRATWGPNGSLSSRAMANIMRMHDVWTARQHTVIAMAESMRKTLPTVLPSASLTM